MKSIYHSGKYRFAFSVERSRCYAYREQVGFMHFLTRPHEGETNARKELGLQQRDGTAGLVKPGVALKSFRTERGLTLSELSQLSGLPISTLSKIENEKMELTIDKLLRISLALDVNIADVFGTPTNQTVQSETSRRRCVTRGSEGKMVASPNGDYRYQAYDLLNKDMTPIVAEIHARSMDEFGDFHRHHGEEYVYVIDGELALYTDTYMPTVLQAGDSIYFDSGMGHAYIAVGDAPCRILSVFSSSEAQTVGLIERQADVASRPFDPALDVGDRP